MNRYTVITGASSGIGYEAAKEFARRGENLILIARRADRLENLKSEISKLAPKADVIIKISDISKIQNVYKCYEELKTYDIKTWINNAGFGDYSLVGDQDLEKIETMINLNITALTVFSTLFVRDYRCKDCTLINISSAGGYSIVSNAVTYCASKFYVSVFTEGLYHELKQDENVKMRVKVLAPAATKTEFGKVATSSENYDYDKHFKKYHTSKQMAEFLLKLYDSDKCVGFVNRNTFDFILEDPKFDYVSKARNS